MIRHHLMTIMVPVALGTACFIGGNPPDNSDGGNPDGSTVLPFQADSPFVYVDKVKNILTGLPATQVEVDKVANAGDQNAMQAALVQLIDTWMTYPQYSQKMMTFFELAFQQTQLSQVDFNNIVPNGNGSIGTSNNVNLLIQNVKESFSRTVLDRIVEGTALHRRVHDDEVHDDARARGALRVHGVEPGLGHREGHRRLRDRRTRRTASP